MSFHQFFAEQDINKLDMGFNSALFINIPSWDKTLKKDLQNKEIISAESTPDQNRLMELNKSFVNNLLSKDLIKKLEEASPFKNSDCEFDQFLENKKFLRENKLCFEEEENDLDDLEYEDSETKASKISKYSKDSKESIFSVDGLNLKRSNNSCLFQENEEHNALYPEMRINYNNTFKAAKSFEHNISDVYNGKKIILLNKLLNLTLFLSSFIY